jgi:hypothetical protein
MTTLEEAEIIPGKNSNARRKPLALANGHGRYTAVTPEQNNLFVGEWPFHSLGNGRFM